MAKPKFTGTVLDMFDGNSITYPVVGRPVNQKFDNIFTRKGQWYYVNSVENQDDPRLTKQNQTVERCREHWITLCPTTGEIIKTQSPGTGVSTRTKFQCQNDFKHASFKSQKT